MYRNCMGVTKCIQKYRYPNYYFYVYTCSKLFNKTLIFIMLTAVKTNKNVLAFTNTTRKIKQHVNSYSRVNLHVSLLYIHMKIL